MAAVTTDGDSADDAAITRADDRRIAAEIYPALRRFAASVGRWEVEPEDPYDPANDPFWQTEGGRNFAEAYDAGFLLMKVPGHPEGGLVTEEFTLFGEPGEIMEVRNWSRELVGYYLAQAGIVAVEDVDLADPQWERLAAEIFSEDPGASFCAGGEEGQAPVCVDEPPFFEQLEANGGFGPVQLSPPIPDRGR